MKKSLFIFTILILILLNAFSQNLMDITPNSYVMDTEGVFNEEQKNDLIMCLKAYEDSTSIQIVVATSSDFDFVNSTDLANKWHIGQRDLNNGLLIIFSKNQHYCDMRTGYGLEEFLSDGWLKNMQSEVFPEYFGQELYYAGLKECIVRIQNKLGYDGYAFLVEQQTIKKAKMKEKISNFFSFILKILIIGGILFLIGYLFYVFNKKHEKKILLKNEIISYLNNIESIYSYLNKAGAKIPSDIINSYDSRITNKFSIETKINNLNVYNKLFNFRKLFDKINCSIIDIKNQYENIKNLNADIDDIYHNSLNVTISNESLFILHSNYQKIINFKNLMIDVDKKINSIKEKILNVNIILNKKHDYCDDIKKDLITLNNITINTDYTNDNLSVLCQNEKMLYSKLENYKSKIRNIDNIVNLNSNINTIISKLKASYNIYLDNYKILTNSKIGNRKIDTISFDENKLKNIIISSMNYLKENNYDMAMSFYETFNNIEFEFNKSCNNTITLLNILQNSNSYLKMHTNDINDFLSKIKLVINETGVDYRRVSEYNKLKTKCEKFLNSDIIDYITEAEALEILLTSLKTLKKNVDYDIDEYMRISNNNKYNSYNSYNSYKNSYKNTYNNSNDSNDYGSSSSSTYDSGFSSGGGDFGGGGAGSDW